MVYNPQVSNTSALLLAFNGLTHKDRKRLRELMMALCTIGRSTFYQWLRTPEMIPRGYRYNIAQLFNINPEELFPKE